MNEQKAKCEATEKRETERRQVEEKKHNEEIQFLKRTNQQLKVRAARERCSPTCPPAAGRALPSFLQMTLNTCPHVLPRCKSSCLVCVEGERLRGR